MKKGLLLALFFSVFLVNGAMAGSASLLGEWAGEARAILPDGTVIEPIPLEGKLTFVDGSLFSGTFVFTVPGVGQTTAYATGNVTGQKIKGIMSIAVGGGLFQGIGIFEAKLKGMKMVGVVCDFSDGSTTYFTAERSD